jgi:hypothetical protein
MFIETTIISVLGVLLHHLLKNYVVLLPTPPYLPQQWSESVNTSSSRVFEMEMEMEMEKNATEDELQSGKRNRSPR